MSELKARLDRLESLVGTAYAANGTVRPALENAALQQDVEQMRVEVQAVCNFLRDNDPNPEPPAPL
jgi:outer membrane murein-binding lipoprotein Lpp